MNKGMLSVGIILLSVVALLLLNVLSNYSTGGELDYYLVKETVDAAIVDAIDASYLRTCGLYRMDREKFVESFLYRFADSVDTSRSYKIEIYDLNEVPPKVSVKVDSLTSLTFNAQGEQVAPNITTSYDAILETTYKDDVTVREGIEDSVSDKCAKLYEYSYS
ncbi:MAG: hypothetical protein IJ463_01235 [Bacilli bacterium]|nr:hypothetical protein [Bacilli bacterium]